MIWVLTMADTGAMIAAAVAAAFCMRDKSGTSAEGSAAGAPGTAEEVAAGSAGFCSGGLKNTGKGDPPIGVPFTSMLSYKSTAGKPQTLSIAILSRGRCKDRYKHQYRNWSYPNSRQTMAGKAGCND